MQPQLSELWHLHSNENPFTLRQMNVDLVRAKETASSVEKIHRRSATHHEDRLVVAAVLLLAFEWKN